MNNKLKPALLGGLIVGLLSAIPVINYCCCIWAIGGGLVASLLYIKSSQVPVGAGDGAMVGGLAGVFGAIIYLIIGIPIAFLMVGPAALEAQLRGTGLEVPLSGALLLLVGGLLGAVTLLVLSVLGGLLAVPIFEKRKGQGVPPPPPQNLGGQGGYGSGM
jgi:hypothetical protein